MKRRMYGGADVRRALSIEELRGMARRRLPNFVWEYLEGGAEDEVTLRRNRAVFDAVRLLPRTLVDVSARRRSVPLFGAESAAPFVVGPTGFNGLLSHRADLALARAAAAAGVPFVLSHVATMPIEEIAREAGGRLWMQLYLFRSREAARAVVDRAEGAGCEALVVTTDSSVFGNREWDRRNYRAPMRLDARNMLDVLVHPRWLLDVLVPHGVPRFGNLGGVLPPGQDSARNAAAFLAREMDQSLRWEDIAWLRGLWPRRLIVKGILAAEDAERAVACGADGIVLTNHGGRQLDGAVTALEMLPGVAAAVGGRAAILLDGGVRRGADIVKAVVPGAWGVLLGRAPLYRVGAGGEAGAVRALDILGSETDRVLGLLGCPDVGQLDRSYLRVPAEWGRRSAEFEPTDVA